MPVPSTRKYTETRKQEIAEITTLRRHFRSELKKLRSLPSPEVTLHWWAKSYLQVEYRAKLLNMRDAAKWLSKFLLLVEGPELSSEDSAREGTRTFRCLLQKGDARLSLSLVVSVFTTEENPLANCRKVQVGVDTHTYTSTTPRYELICD
jgi:hypothetical protein